MSFILGFDASTQSLSALIIDTDSGQIISENSSSFGNDLADYGHPSGFIPNASAGVVHANPLMWLDALDLLLSQINPEVLSQVTALSGSGQQHGSVYLNEKFSQTVTNLDPTLKLATQLAECLSRKKSPIWMDNSTTPECAEIAARVGGNDIVSQKSGSIATERFTGSQIRKFSKNEPDAWQETKTVHLVSSFLCSILAGQSAAIDMGDGAGMNLLNLATKNWDKDLVHATAENLIEKLPPITQHATEVGSISPYFVKKYGFSTDCKVVNWSGDNPCSLVGMGASTLGKAVISLGTSDTFFASMAEPKTDPNCYGHVFGNPMGNYMSLICFRNGSLARESVKQKFQLDWNDFDTAGLVTTNSGNDGKLMLPFFSDEITPRMTSTAPTFDSNWTEQENSNPQLMVRATLEGQFLNMKTQSLWMGMTFNEVLVTGGASQNNGICQIIANVFGCTVSRIDTTNSAALGAAIIAATTTTDSSLESLEAAFCVKTNSISPEEQAHETYQKLLPHFQTLIQNNL